MTFRRRRATDCKFQVPAHQETGREKFNSPMSQENPDQASGDRLDFPSVQPLGDWSRKVPERLQIFKKGLSGEPSDSHNVVKQLIVEPTRKTHDDMRAGSEDGSTDLGAETARKREETVLITHQKFGDAVTADHNVLSEEKRISWTR